jgi:hypothetical protein
MSEENKSKKSDEAKDKSVEKPVVKKTDAEIRAEIRAEYKAELEAAKPKQTFEESQAEIAEKKRIEKEGREYGVEIDRRKSIEDCQADLDKAKIAAFKKNNGLDPRIYTPVIRKTYIVEPINGIKEPFAGGSQPPIDLIDGVEYLVDDRKTQRPFLGWKVNFGEPVELNQYIYEALRDATSARPIKKKKPDGGEVKVVGRRRNYSIEEVN